jgi:hypothetical protein
MSNSTAVTPVPLYAGFERVMEQKAIALGVRREFFQCLQRNRDYVRTYLSDLTHSLNVTHNLRHDLNMGNATPNSERGWQI